MLRISFGSLQRNKTSLCSLVFTRWCKTVPETAPVLDASIEGLENELPSAEEIARICDKSRVSEDIRNRYIRKVYEKPTDDNGYTLQELRNAYGEFGKSSGLNPGLCWSTEEELARQLEYDSLTITPLHEMIGNIKKRKKAEATARLKKEQEVEKNLLKFTKMNEEYKAQEKIKEEAALAQIKKKEQIINEIREEIGYNIDERDPRFRDTLLRREEELKKEAKEAKKKKNKQKKLEYIQQLADETKALRKDKDND